MSYENINLHSSLQDNCDSMCRDNDINMQFNSFHEYPITLLKINLDRPFAPGRLKKNYITLWRGSNVWNRIKYTLTKRRPMLEK